jgi:quercetin dioxygenase-like cupin family protein
MSMQLDEAHGVLLEPGTGAKLERPELLVSELDRIPEAGVAPHFHREHADAFFVLEGKIVFELAGESVEASFGTFVLAPAGFVHGFRPPEGRFLNLHAPGAPYFGRGDTYDPPADGSKGEAIVVPPGEGERLAIEKRVAYIKASLPALTLSVSELATGFEGPEPHVHDDHVDSFYVLEGDVEFVLGDKAVRAGPGTFFAAPPGIVHTFTNPGPDGARLLNMHTPDAGFADFLRRQST